MSLLKFFDNKFALVFDLRSIDDPIRTENGKMIKDTQNGILLEIEKEAISENVKCHTFVLADAAANFKSGGFKMVNF